MEQSVGQHLKLFAVVFGDRELLGLADQFDNTAPAAGS